MDHTKLTDRIRSETLRTYTKLDAMNMRHDEMAMKQIFRINAKYNKKKKK